MVILVISRWKRGCEENRRILINMVILVILCIYLLNWYRNRIMREIILGSRKIKLYRS
jgi:hypothetical protein